MDLMRWLAIGVAAFVLLLALADLPFVRGTTRNGEIIGDCVADKGGKVAKSRDSLRFAQADVAAGRVAELGGTTLGDSKEVAVRFAPISEGQPPYELLVVARQPFNTLVRPEQLRKIVNDPGSFALVAYIRPADDARGRRFWDCVAKARKNA